MNSDYFIKVVGTMEPAKGEDAPDKIELMTHGSFAEKGGSFYIIYKETEATGYGGCTTTIKIDKAARRAAMLRSGNKPSQLIIEKGIRHICHYETGYGTITLGVEADEIDHHMSETGGTASFSYTLDSGGSELLSRNRVELTVKRCREMS